MAIEAKKNTDTWFPVILISSSDLKTPVLGVTFDQVTAKYSYQGTSAFTSYTVTVSEWKEIGSGVYWLLIGQGEFVSNGLYQIQVNHAGSVNYNFIARSVNKTQDELATDLDTLLSRLPSALSINAGVVEANIKQVDDSTVDSILDFHADTSALATQVSVDSVATQVSVVDTKVDNVPTAVDAELSSNHTAGSWAGAVVPADVLGISVFVDLLYNKQVLSRHANRKPSQLQVGTGANARLVNTTIDGNGDTSTEELQ